MRLDLDIQDNTGVPNTAVTLLQKQSVDSPDIYVSGVKPQTMAIFDRVAEKGWPYFVWVLDAFITEKHSNIFRTWVD